MTSRNRQVAYGGPRAFRRLQGPPPGSHRAPIGPPPWLRAERFRQKGLAQERHVIGTIAVNGIQIFKGGGRR
ncbi:hypothetical protein NHX12_003134 [Muraenolepis orangiensis]|uniref:Uncharacterized protein n=1 Tax=Muraenolepis orangiensis TaxID=630683 RepID=A0A9Q0DXG2_9TELE|nr:hypothetical protein NHX12_003134 [Muraenolepis orangiensis]